MRIFRLNRAFNLIALVALTLQIVVSFGHVHLSGIYLSYHDVGVGSAAPQVAPSPSAPRPGDQDNSYCAVCATIYLAANSFVPQAPSLVVPFASRPIERVERAAMVFVVPWRTPVQSRAPPQL